MNPVQLSGLALLVFGATEFFLRKGASGQELPTRRTTGWALRSVTPAVFTLTLLLTTWDVAAETVVSPAMIGDWQGNARIIVTWCQQRVLPVDLDIHADGNVTGKVGDATLTKGRLQRNRGWVGRKLDLKTDYIIAGKLSRPV